MQFTVRTKLSPDECKSRLSKAIEGPIPKVGVRLDGWHYFGRVSGSDVEATIVGVAVDKRGRRRAALRPMLTAQIAPGKDETILTGEIAARYQPRQGVLDRFVLPLAIIGSVVWVMLSLSTRWPILAFDILIAALVVFARMSRAGYNGLAAEGEEAILAWLEKSVKGTRE